MQNFKIITMTLLFVNFSLIKSDYFLNSILTNRKRIHRHRKNPKQNLKNYYKRIIIRLKTELKFLKEKNEKLKKKNLYLKFDVKKKFSIIKQKNRNLLNKNLNLKIETLRLKWKIKSFKKKNKIKKKKKKKKYFFFKPSFSEFQKKEKKLFFVPFHKNFWSSKIKNKDHFFFN